LAIRSSDQKNWLYSYLLLPGLLGMAYVVAQWLTLGHYPEVWVDEVAYTDPAWHWAHGQGLVSRAWPNQLSGEYWAGNVPLHAWLLGGWLCIWGTTEYTVRLFGIVCMATGLAIWLLAARRIFPAQPRWLGWTFIILLAANGHVWWLARAGRPEPLAFLLLSLLVLVWTSPPAREQLFLLAFLAGLLICTGLYWLVPLALLLVYVWVYAPQQKAGAGMLAAGAAFGLALLLAWYAVQGVLYPFLVNTLLSSHTVTGNVAQTLAVEGVGLSKVMQQFGKLLDFRHLYGQDMGWVAGAVAVGTGLIGQVQTKASLNTYPSVKVLFLVAILLPFGLQLAGKFAYYYLWISLLPLYLALSLTLAHWYEGSGLNKRIAAMAVFLAVLAIGLPWKALHAPKGCAESCSQWLANLPVTANDAVYTDYPFYYVLKQQTPRVYLPNYATGKRVGAMPELEAAEIGFILVPASGREAAVKRLGGQWETLAACPCNGQLQTSYVLLKRR
jgi:hypothetical protein